jgi:hypothetical protein
VGDFELEGFSQFDNFSNLEVPQIGGFRGRANPAMNDQSASVRKFHSHQKKFKYYRSNSNDGNLER